MKREDLKTLGLTDEQVDSVMGLHGKDIESHKTKLTEAETARDQFKAQLDEANTAIEGFKKMKPEELQKAADDWKTKFEQAQEESKTQLAAVKFDHALETALSGAKVRNIKTVLPLLNREKLILQDDGTITGLDDQLKPIKEQNDYLFISETPTPRIVTGGNNQTVTTDAFEAALMKGAGIKPSEAPKG